MTDRADLLSAVPLLGEMSDAARAAVAELGEPVSFDPGTLVYGVGDAADAFFVVDEGAVGIYANAGGVEKLFSTATAGVAFGMHSLLDRGERSGTARADAPTSALRVTYARVDELVDSAPELGIELLRAVGRALGTGLRLLVEQYQEMLAWNLEATGLSTLNLETVMADGVRVTVETVRGEPMTGLLLRYELSDMGHELYLQDGTGAVHLVPYHALVRISVAASDAAALRHDPS